MIEWADNATGRLQAKAFRQNHQEFKGRKLREVLQLMPSKVPCGQVVEWTYHNPA